MTVDNEQPKSKPLPKPKPIPLGTSITVGEPKFERLPSEDPEAGSCNKEVESNDKKPKAGYGWFPKPIRQRIRRKTKRAFCCLGLLLLLNLMVAGFIAKKISYVSYVLLDSEVAYMPGGTHPFCSDLCVDLCIGENDDGNDNEHDDGNSISCDISDCMNACSSHFENQDDNDGKPCKGGKHGKGKGGRHGGNGHGHHDHHGHDSDSDDNDDDNDDNNQYSDKDSSDNDNNNNGWHKDKNGGRSHRGGGRRRPRAMDLDRRVGNRFGGF